MLSPEVLDTVNNQTIAQKNTRSITQLLSFDALWIAGQAKSHCVAWTIENLLEEIVKIDPYLTHEIYLIEDCMSPVIIPGVIDFTDQANIIFQRFADAGMNLVKSSDNFFTH